MYKTNSSLLNFLILLIATSIPFWLAGALIQPAGLPINLPVSALMAFNPAIVASILISREQGWSGVKNLFKRVFDFHLIPNKVWYVAIFGLMPLIMVLHYLVILLLGKSMVDPQIRILEVPIMFLVFFLSAAGEELGWQGYVYARLRSRWNVLGSAVILGIIWAVWHIIPYIQTHNTASWILWQCVVTIGLRVIIVWFYLKTGSCVFVAITFHTMINVSTFAFPNYGSYYDPLIASVIVGVVVLVLWSQGYDE